MKHLIVIAGATASGKTALGIALAKYFQTAILSADSRQFYREMAIGTAKPTDEEQAAATHYFVNNLSIEQHYTVGDYERDALSLLQQLFEKHDIVLMVGGSGLFIQAVCEGLNEFPEVPTDIREALTRQFETEGIAALQNELKIADPAYYETVDLSNHHRLIRALEVCRATGLPFSTFRNQHKTPRFFQPIYLVLDWERAALYERINRRVDLMLEAGLMQEVHRLYPLKYLNALQTVGYQEFFDYLDGEYDFDEAVRLVKRNSRRYAKRQITWFKKLPDAAFFHPNEQEKIIDFLEKIIRKK